MAQCSLICRPKMKIQTRGRSSTMANIICRKTAHNDKDPFHQSDRDPIGRCAGKGDRPRNVGGDFKKNFDLIDWGRKSPRKPGRTVTRYK
jgi:hypothetical protein